MDDAVGPDVAAFTVCGLAVDMPVAGSAFPGGQRPRLGFFLVAQPLASTGACTAPFTALGVVVTVDVEEAAEEIEELEFCRCAVLR